MNQLSGSVFITGGSGTIGQAIIRRATEENWDCDITIYSRGWKAQADVKRKYPKVKCILGDILDQISLQMAITGHDIVVHAAAQKHIVRGEEHPLSVIETNVSGSINVLQACLDAEVKHVIGLSTDKAVMPINAYGASKMLMEKTFQQYAMNYEDREIEFHLVRYGNVLGSAGSFIHSWRASQLLGEPVWSTDPNMTRFWLTEDGAIDLILECLDDLSGAIRVPWAKSAQVGDIEKWVLGKKADHYIGRRPGEKIHESLITNLDYYYDVSNEWVILMPTTGENRINSAETFTSENAVRFTKEEFLAMLGDM